jgi:aldehyde:ferredoxin oxidoreductase
LKCNAGGAWGAELRYAGYIAVVVVGRSNKPVYLSINNEQAELRDASHLWGSDVVETNQKIWSELDDRNIKIACIGQGGENLVTFASVMFSTYNAAGRGGVGAVMGAKRLKAIAVRGTCPVQVADPQTFSRSLAALHDQLHPSETPIDTEKPYGTGMRDLHLYGTSGGVPAWNEMKVFPAFNFQKCFYEDAEKLGGVRLVKDGFLKRRVGCFSCPISCHRYVEIDEGQFVGTFCGGPEYEAVGSLGAGCGVSDLEHVIAANALCNRYGLDTISTGSVIQWLLECNQRNLDFDHDGLDLRWGQGDTVVELVNRIAHRKGIGNLLAKGVREAARIMGQDSYKWAVEAKGLEQSRVDTRSAYSYALGFAVNPRGPDHLHTMASVEFGFSPEARAVIQEITGNASLADPRSTEMRAEIVRWHEDVYAVVDSLGLCFFGATNLHFVDESRRQNLASLIAGAVGCPISAEEMMRLGRKIVTLEKCYNVREGCTREDDRLPWRLMHESPDGVTDTNPTEFRKKLNVMLDRYYELHGWDPLTSWPTTRTLQELDLGDVAELLERMGKAPE